MDWPFNFVLDSVKSATGGQHRSSQHRRVVGFVQQFAGREPFLFSMRRFLRFRVFVFLVTLILNQLTCWRCSSLNEWDDGWIFCFCLQVHWWPSHLPPKQDLMDEFPLALNPASHLHAECLSTCFTCPLTGLSGLPHSSDWNHQLWATCIQVCSTHLELYEAKLHKPGPFLCGVSVEQHPPELRAGATERYTTRQWPKQFPYRWTWTCCRIWLAYHSPSLPASNQVSWSLKIQSINFFTIFLKLNGATFVILGADQCQFVDVLPLIQSNFKWISFVEPITRLQSVVHEIAAVSLFAVIIHWSVSRFDR